MNFIDLKQKIYEEISIQFKYILDWLNSVGEVGDLTDINLVIQRKNFLIIGIYSANEYIIEIGIKIFYEELFLQLENETGNVLWSINERLKIESIIKNNHNGTKDGLCEMLSKIIGNVHSKKVIEEIKSKMGIDFKSFCSELGRFKDFRDKQTHSSENFFSDKVGRDIDIQNSKIIQQITNLENLFKKFYNAFYDELNVLYKLK